MSKLSKTPFFFANGAINVSVKTIAISQGSLENALRVICSERRQSD